MIGRGSYGEVWLARTVTGSWRAVKIVWLGIHEEPKVFEREFEGMRAFEPISRSHEGLVDILHVGRNDEAGYFYYSMELADDLIRGRNVDPATYQPHTLRTQMRLSMRLPPRRCLSILLGLARGLEHLHAQGLVHRDLKPSNIVLVDGCPKLADVGLVASADSTMSFVGTEGYVPPEGPGTIRADVYALGKVLYEISTGCDRRQFPELPSDFGAIDDRQMFLELNEVTSRACARDARDAYASAAELRADLERVEAGRTVRRFRFRRVHRTALAALALVLFTALVVLGLVRVFSPWGRVIEGSSSQGRDRADVAVPQQVAEAQAHPVHHEAVMRVSGRGRHTVALVASGQLLAWGHNDRGQLGTGDRVSRLWPTRIGSESDWTEVDAGDSFTVGLKKDGTIWVWGGNDFGELGTTNQTDCLAPVRLGDAHDWQSIQAGWHNAYAYKRDRSLWGWGRNDKGQLMKRSDAHIRHPIQLAVPGIWTSLDVHYEHAVGIRADGSLWSWGETTAGRIGRESGENPVRVPGLLHAGPGWVCASLGFWHTLALRNDGTLWGWGWSAHGQLGMGDTKVHAAMAQIGSEVDWVSICAASEHSLALKRDGSLWAWGAGNLGEVGDGERIDRVVPVQVGRDRDWIGLPRMAGNTSFALKRDGSLWGWGLNRFGQLGDGSYRDAARPVRILPPPP